MRIILVRHARAEDQHSFSTDFDRKLTDEGRKEFEDRLPELRDKLDPKKKILIWSSPAARARQTAELLAEGIGDPKIEFYDFLYYSDYDAFCFELKYVEEDRLLFVVGHEPDLSEWAFRITGSDVKMKKGSLLAIQIWSRTPVKGRIEWQINGPKPSETAQEEEITFPHYQSTLLSQMGEILERLSAFREDPQEPETTHQLRVAVRTARSLLSFVNPLLLYDEYRFYQDKLRAIAGRFGLLRELDVLVEQWLSYSGIEVGESALAKAFLSDRTEKQEELTRYANSISIPNDIEDLSAWIQSWPASSDDFTKFAAERFAKWNKRVDKRLDSADFHEWAEIHPIRIAYKKIRYVQRAFPQLETVATLDLKDLKDLQDDLGIICDTYVNEEILEEAMKKHGEEFQMEATQFITHLVTLRHEREEHVISTKLDQDQMNQSSESLQ